MCYAMLYVMLWICFIETEFVLHYRWVFQKFYTRVFLLSFIHSFTDPFIYSEFSDSVVDQTCIHIWAIYLCIHIVLYMNEIFHVRGRMTTRAMLKC